jgi:hypothetical protein
MPFTSASCKAANEAGQEQARQGLQDIELKNPPA